MRDDDSHLLGRDGRRRQLGAVGGRGVGRLRLRLARGSWRRQRLDLQVDRLVLYGDLRQSP
jgi:hypothetical protein